MATFAAMRRFLGITTIMLWAFMAFGQGTGNPFDLKYRKPVPKSKAEVPAPKKDSLSTKASPTPSTNPSTPSVTPATPDTSIKSAPVREDSIPGAGKGNPFEIGRSKDTLSAAGHVKSDTSSSQLATGKNPPPALRTGSSRGFQIFFLLLSLLLLIFIVNVERSFVRDLWRVISNENYSSLHHRNQRNTMRQILLLMGYSIFIFQAGTFLYHILRVFRYTGSLLDSIWVCIVLVLGIYVIRHAMIRYLRWLFNNEKEMTLFGFDISIFNTMLGLILLPVNILLLFGPENLYKPLVIIGLVVVGAAYMMRQLRWLLSAHQLIGNSLFLFFIYLCAVEILPLWAVSALFW